MTALCLRINAGGKRIEEKKDKFSSKEVEIEMTRRGVMRQYETGQDGWSPEYLFKTRHQKY